MATDAPTETALSLASAVIITSPFPLVMLDRDLNVVVASASFCDSFEIDCRDVAGRAFLAFAGDRDTAVLRALLMETAAGGAPVMGHALELQAGGPSGRKVVLSAHKLDYDDVHQVRLLMSIVPADDARASQLLAEKLHREAALLLQEVRHRAANSLQIIGGVLLLTANKSQSREVRAQLTDAYLRVMSVAELERQLSPSEASDVALRPYLETLCERIGESMVADRSQVTLRVEADDRVVTADVSMSVGLIVTELVINALKHAFPDGRKGQVVVGCRASDAGWTVTVGDDGVGFRTRSPAPKVGLGTVIIEALALQHGATLSTEDAGPGTLVSVTFTESASPSSCS